MARPRLMGRAQKLALASACVGTVVLGLKYAAYWVTGSIALYSDALESVINVVAAGAAFIALRVSAQPADSNHPYGHHKAEYFSAVFEGGLVLVAAVSIFRYAYLGFLTPKPLDTPFIGLAINAGASFINALWAWLLLIWGRRWRSPALVADGRHVLTDVFTSAGALPSFRRRAGSSLTQPSPFSSASISFGRDIKWFAGVRGA